jgi:hypothetical protein
MVSIPLDYDSEMPLSDLASSVNSEGKNICPWPSLKGTNTLYRCEKQSKVVYILNHDITASFTLYIDPEMP